MMTGARIMLSMSWVPARAGVVQRGGRREKYHQRKDDDEGEAPAAKAVMRMTRPPKQPTMSPAHSFRAAHRQSKIGLIVNADPRE